MEVKKSLKADLEGTKSTSWLIGLVLVMAVMFVAFEWTQHDIKIIDNSEPVFTAAIEEGSTEVRIGTRLFGSR